MKQSLNKCWKPATPVRRPDKIISSDARHQGDLYGFTPSYAADPRCEMWALLSYEYHRQWFAEKKQGYEKLKYTALQTAQEESRIRRRFVQRDMVKKEHIKPLPIIHLKRFENIPSKTDHSKPEAMSTIRRVRKCKPPRFRGRKRSKKGSRKGKTIPSSEKKNKRQRGGGGEEVGKDNALDKDEIITTGETGGKEQIKSKEKTRNKNESKVYDKFDIEERGQRSERKETSPSSQKINVLQQPEYIIGNGGKYIGKRRGNTCMRSLYSY